MVAPRLRSTSVRTRHRRSPGGKPVVIYKIRKPSRATCALCEEKLNAVPKRKGVELKKLSKTERRPERKFGGVLCASCTRAIIKFKTRLETGAISETDVPLNLLRYVNMLKR